MTTLPTTPTSITAAYLDALLRDYPDAPYSPVTAFTIDRLSKGTSGAGLYVVTIDRDPATDPLRFILKLSGGPKEVYFYRDLAPRLPIDTPAVLDARILDDGTTWLLMEQITGVKDGLAWDQSDYRAVLTGMARLHAAYWSRPDLLAGCPWLWRPDPTSLQTLVAARKTDLQAIVASTLPQQLPSIFTPDRLSLALHLLDHPHKLFDPLLAPGTTLVHGDYWFHNVQITRTGRIVLVDWQDPQTWSGLWELAYFLNLLLPVSATEYRTSLPLDETLMINCYTAALSDQGVSLPQPDFDAALLAARVWHPIQHWIRQYGYAAAKGLLPTGDLQALNPGAAQFLASTFSRWDHDAHTLLNT